MWLRKVPGDALLRYRSISTLAYFAGMKDSSGCPDSLQRIVRAVQEERGQPGKAGEGDDSFTVMAGSASAYAQSLLNGAGGGIMGLANLYGGALRRIGKLLTGAEGVDVQQEALQLNERLALYVLLPASVISPSALPSKNRIFFSFSNLVALPLRPCSVSLLLFLFLSSLSL